MNMAGGISMTDKQKFALYFGNRGMFPASLIGSARAEMEAAVKRAGYDTLVLDAAATRHGAVETPAEGRVYADFLAQHKGEYSGVIVCLPNFGDENGAVVALRDAGVPMLIQAYPDDLDKMAPELRRDSFCGKFSIMDVFCQNEIPFTALKPHTVHPSSPQFADNLKHFAAVCRVVAGMRRMNVGAIGARTTLFKTVRIDELALQRHGITMETFDLSDVFARVRSLDAACDAYKCKANDLQSYTDFSRTPAAAFDNIVRLGVVLDQMIDEAKLDAIAVRCWIEIQQQLGISPCVLLSEMNNRGRIASCEVDVANALAMYALSLATGDVSSCLDWNNNYADDENKCILFHCGPVPQSMMTAKGLVTGHSILETSVGKGCTYGCNVGRIKPMPFTFSSMTTVDGYLSFYAGEGRFTADPIADDFFGCAGVAEIPDLQDVLLYIGKNGHRHHVSVSPGNVSLALAEALGDYLGYAVDLPQGLA
jgi:L-fucose isomerase-like protein